MGGGSIRLEFLLKPRTALTGLSRMMHWDVGDGG